MLKRALYEKRIGGALGALAGAGAGYAAAEPEHKWKGMFAGGVLGGALGTGAGHAVSKWRSPSVTPPAAAASPSAPAEAAEYGRKPKAVPAPAAAAAPKTLAANEIAKWRKKLPGFEAEIQHLASPAGGGHQELLANYNAFRDAIQKGDPTEISAAYRNYVTANKAVNKALNAARQPAKTSSLRSEIEKRAWKAQSFGALGGALLGGGLGYATSDDDDNRVGRTLGGALLGGGLGAGAGHFLSSRSTGGSAGGGGSGGGNDAKSLSQKTDEYINKVKKDLAKNPALNGGLGKDINPIPPIFPGEPKGTATFFAKARILSDEMKRLQKLRDANPSAWTAANEKQLKDVTDATFKLNDAANEFARGNKEKVRRLFGELRDEGLQNYNPFRTTALIDPQRAPDSAKTILERRKAVSSPLGELWPGEKATTLKALKAFAVLEDNGQDTTRLKNLLAQAMQTSAARHAQEGTLNVPALELAARLKEQVNKFSHVLSPAQIRDEQARLRATLSSPR